MNNTIVDRLPRSDFAYSQNMHAMKILFSSLISTDTFFIITIKILASQRKNKISYNISSQD